MMLMWWLIGGLLLWGVPPLVVCDAVRGRGAEGPAITDTRQTALAAAAAVAKQQQEGLSSVSMEGSGLLTFLQQQEAPAAPPLARRGGRVSAAVEAVLAGMSLEEKVGQMTQLAIGAIWDADAGAVDEAKAADLFSKYKIGSIFDNPYGAQKKGLLDAKAWRAISRSVQSAAKKAGVPVPVVYGIDSIHGASYVHGATLFPQQINLGAALNTTLAAAMGTITAKDTAAAGLHWVFSPVLCLASQPLWARVWETFGEDPYIIGSLGTAYIQALQGWRGGGQPSQRVAGTMKHYIAYSSPRSGHDRSTTSLDSRLVRQYYIPPFREAVSAGGVLTAMESYGDIAQVPLAANKEFFDVLRLDLGFGGLVVTDFDEVANLANFHKTAKDHAAAVRSAMTHTSIDMSMAPTSPAFASDLVALVKAGTIPIQRVDDSVRRVLQLKEWLGLLEEGGGPQPDDEQVVGSEEDWALALEAARESITLLKNQDDKTLPLTGVTKLLVVGPTANSLTYQTGGWSLHWQGATEEADLSTATPQAATIVQGLQREGGEGMQVVYSLGVDVKGQPDPDVTRASLVEAAGGSDAVVVCLGEESYTEKPGDIDDLGLPWGQVQLAMDMIATGKPVVLVLVAGRPRVLYGLEALAPAIVHAYLPGPLGGRAVAEVLLGKVNPSGRLPYTYPAKTGATVTYWEAPTQLCVDAKGGYVRCPVAFPFGTGLSYTTFKYSKVSSSRWEVTEDDSFHITLTVTNTGAVPGKHSVQLYMTALSRSVEPEWRLLRGFTKVDLQPGQSTDVVFNINVRKDMSFVGVSRREELESAEFFFWVGGTEPDYCRNGGPDCLYVKLTTSDKYNPVCEHACRLLSSSAALGCGPGPTEKECKETCLAAAAKPESAWGWSYVWCLEEQLSPHHAGAKATCHLDTNCRPILLQTLTPPPQAPPQAPDAAASSSKKKQQQAAGGANNNRWADAWKGEAVGRTGGMGGEDNNQGASYSNRDRLVFGLAVGGAALGGALLGAVVTKMMMRR